MLSSPCQASNSWSSPKVFCLFLPIFFISLNGTTMYPVTYKSQILPWHLTIFILYYLIHFWDPPIFLVFTFPISSATIFQTTTMSNLKYCTVFLIDFSHLCISHSNWFVTLLPRRIFSKCNSHFVLLSYKFFIVFEVFRKKSPSPVHFFQSQKL